MAVNQIGSSFLKEVEKNNKQKEEEILSAEAKFFKSIQTEDISEISKERNPEWHSRVRNFDEQLKLLQDRISRNNFKRDGLVDIQNELLEYTGFNFPEVRDKVQNIIKNTRYNGEQLLIDFELKKEDDLYEMLSFIEIEKNKLKEENSVFLVELKTISVAKQNIIISETGADNIKPESVISFFNSFSEELSRISYLDNNRIKDLLK